MPACCCGVPPPKPGPPGSISGQVIFTAGEEPRSLAVYAVDSYAMDFDGRAPYVLTRLTSPQTQFTLPVPPGEYKVVARLDSDPLSGAGYTFNLGAGELANDTLMRVRVESKQSVIGITVGDWGTVDSLRTIVAIDMHGAPLTLTTAPARSVPSRVLPNPIHALTSHFVRPVAGYSINLPAGWHDVIFSPYPGSDDHYASEDVRSPLQLSAGGMWLTVRFYISSACPDVDWRYATANARVRMQNSSDEFYFEDPSGPLGVQPFTGFGFRGGHATGGNCLAFIFTGATRDALESNLSDIAGILKSVTFMQPQY